MIKNVEFLVMLELPGQLVTKVAKETREIMEKLAHEDFKQVRPSIYISLLLQGL